MNEQQFIILLVRVISFPLVREIYRNGRASQTMYFSYGVQRRSICATSPFREASIGLTDDVLIGADVGHVSYRRTE